MAVVDRTALFQFKFGGKIYNSMHCISFCLSGSATKPNEPN